MQRGLLEFRLRMPMVRQMEMLTLWTSQRFSVKTFEACSTYSVATLYYRKGRK